MTISFRFKTILGIALIEGVLLLILIWTGINVMHSSNEEELIKRASTTATLFASATKDAVLTSDLASLDSLVSELLHNPGISYVRIVDSSGQFLAMSGKNAALDRPFRADGHVDDAHDDGIYDTYAEIREGGVSYGRIEIGFPIAELYKLIADAKKNATGIAVLEMCLVALFSYMLGVFLTRQLKSLENASLRISKGELGHQIDVHGKDEIGRTTMAFNEMSRKLHALVTQQRQNNALLETLSRAQTQYICETDPKVLFDNLLQETLGLTESDFGIIGEVLYDNSNKPFLKSSALNNIATSKHYVAMNGDNDIAFDADEINSYADMAIARDDTIIINDNSHPHSTNALTNNQVPLRNIMVIPLRSGSRLVGLLGMANREGGYTRQLSDDLNILWQGIANLIVAHRNEVERIAAEIELYKNSQRTQAILDNVVDGIITIDTQGTIVEYNAAAEDIFGYSQTEVIGKNVKMLMPEPYQNSHDGYLENYILNGKHQVIGAGREVEGVRKNGEVFPIELAVGEVADAGVSSLFIGVVRDITMRKEAEKSIRDSKNMLELVLDSIPARVFWKDRDLRYIGCNQHFAHDAGLQTPQDIIGRTDRDLGWCREIGVTNVDERKVIEEDTSIWNNEEPQTLPGGGTIWLSSRKLPLTDADNNVIGVLGVYEDITERKNAENDLTQAMNLAQDAVRAKAAFLANMSHEIRTPMHGILGMLQLVEKTELNSTQHKHLNTAQRSAKSLLNIINDILDLSKIEAGKLELENIDFNMRELVEDVVVLLSHRAHDKGLDLECMIPSDTLTMLSGDPQRISQIITNLVGNAIKFTENGEVTVQVSEIKHTDTKIQMRFEVNDTGIGIDAEAQEKLFSSFQQADSSMSRKYGGTGLGLTISKQLVELMGGEIGLQSSSGTGSSFWFTLQLDKTANTDEKDYHSLHGLRALIVGESNSVCALLEDGMKYWGMQVDTASNVDSVLPMLKEANETGADYNFVFLSQTISNDNNGGLAHSIKERPALSRIHIIQLNEDSRSGPADKNASVDSYLAKPIRHSYLFDCLANALGVSALLTDKSVNHHETKENNMTYKGNILLVEDNPVNQEVSGEMLRRLGLTVDIVDNGQAAVDSTASKQYDLVLMDCQMPIMDGLEATRMIRERERLNHSVRQNIIALTANAMKGDREHCLEAGMDDYLSKPFTEDDLSTLLAQRIKPIINNNESTNLPVLDTNKLEQLRKIMKDRFNAVIEKFQVNTQNYCNDIRTAITANDAETLIHAAHTIKGSSATLGAVTLSAIAGELEKKARSGNLDGSDECLSRISCEYERFMDAIDSPVNAG